MAKDVVAKAKGIKTRSIVGIVLAFTIIGIFVSLILALIDSIIILCTDWEDEELNDNSCKLLWGLLGLLLLGNIATLVFACKATNK